MTAHLSRMYSSVPKNGWLLSLSITLLVITKQMERVNTTILITLAYLKLFRVLRERLYKIVPVGQMVRIVVVGIEPREIR
jgi:hypothetical protein